MSETPKTTAVTPHTKHPDFPRGSDVSPLLGMISPVAHGTPLGLAQRYAKTGVEAHGRYSTVSIMAETTAGTTTGTTTEQAAGGTDDDKKEQEEEKKEEEKLVAVKKQVLASPTSVSDVSIREWRIFNRLAQLAARRQCINFVLMVECFVERRAEDERRYVDFVLEYADARLDEAARRGDVDLRGYREIVFQLLWALCVAEQEMRFVHRDMHLRNVLLQRPARRTLVSYTDDDGHTWWTRTWIVKISDFGLSRIELDDGTVVANPREPLSEAYTPHTDYESLLANLKGLKISDWADAADSARSDVASFKRALSKACSNMTSIRPLLLHKLFDPLRVKPEDGAAEGDGGNEEIIELTMEGTESDDDVRRRAKRPSDGFVSSLSSRVAELDIEDDSPAAPDAHDERAPRTPRRQSARKAAARKEAKREPAEAAEADDASPEPEAEPGTSATTTPLRGRPKRRSSAKTPASK